jgi:hypothetical protein
MQDDSAQAVKKNAAAETTPARTTQEVIISPMEEL